MEQTLLFDHELIKRYDKSGPRYTSYPTAVQFHERFQGGAYIDMARQSNDDLIPKPLSLYFHLPFCATVCFYCACNKIITANRERAKPYLQSLHKEIAMQSPLYDADRKVEQLHWGGGTPTFISQDQMRALMQTTREHFNLLDDDSGEYSIELDPRELSIESLVVLREIGFNRISLGVQDINSAVQVAVNRRQSLEITRAVIAQARHEKFHSISLDLIYGLPLQTSATFSDTLDAVIDLQPDRLAIYNYAHMPEMFKVQKQINAADLPSPEVKLEILHLAIDKLTTAGYVYIGMDHFAKPDDELAIAQRNGTLHRNFQGYSTHVDCDLIAMGVSAISKVGNSYSQNHRDIDAYANAIDNDRLAVFRGIELNLDDLLRREVISQLICHYELDKNYFNQHFEIDFDQYFSYELNQLASMQDDGILHLENDQIKILPAGRLLIRNVCATFDAYNRSAAENNRFSRMV